MPKPSLLIDSGALFGSDSAAPATCLVQPATSNSRAAASTTVAREIRMSTALRCAHPTRNRLGGPTDHLHEQFACRMPGRNLGDRHRWHALGVRVAIVAESFLPNVNGVTNSVLRVIEHLRRSGHEALVIAPDTPRGQPPADKIHDGIRVHRVPSRMFPKITSLPLGVPRPRMVGVLRGFAPDVVHLASPDLLGWGGMLAARHLEVPTVAVFQTDVAGFAESYGIGFASRAAWAWTRHLHGRADRTLAPSTAAMEDLTAHRIPRVHKWARGVDITGFAPSMRDDALRRSWSPEGKPIVGFVGRLAPEKHVERLAPLAGRGE